MPLARVFARSTFNRTSPLTTHSSQCKPLQLPERRIDGRRVRGIERGTFVIDGKGALVRGRRGAKVPGHARDVPEFVAAL